MARKVGRLTALAVSRAKTSGYLADGGGLYLQVSASGAKSWVFRFRGGAVRGGVRKIREMGLGPLHTVSLAEAREAALACRKQWLAGIDPIEAREAARSAARLEAAKAMTFRQCAEAYIEAHKAGWRNEKHAAQWGATLTAYAYPVFGDLPVQAIDVRLVTKVIEPIWATKTETASRVRGRIENVLDWAAAQGYRRGENPARWKGHIENLLPKRSKVSAVEHHAALRYGEMSAFMAALRGEEGIAARALEFAILTGTRTSETIGATWDELDLDGKVWTIPAERIKAGKEHRVPLSASALVILEEMKKGRTGEFVFPGDKRGRPLSAMAMLKLLERMKHDDLTVHGFRSTFRDWAAERTNFPREVAEMALTHTVSDKVEAAYRRGDLFQKRRQLMDAWAKFCGMPASAGKVVAIGTGRTAPDAGEQ